MTELDRLLLAYDQHRTAGRACALATVVEIEGSAYRRPGARMLVTDDGQLTGAISGGCLEGDARRRARQAIQQQRSTVVTYDTTDDEDPRHGLGPGCQGVVRILLEPLDFQAADNPLELLRVFAAHPTRTVLATIVRTPSADATLGQRLLLTPDGNIRSTTNFEEPLRAAAAAVLAQDASQTLDITTPDGPARVFLEVLRPPFRLTVYGAGNDAQPLVRLAASLGWRVTVVDGRPIQATAARFPEAAAVRVVPLAEVPNLSSDIAYAVLLTHNYAYDLAVLGNLLTGPTPYLGLLGPRTKADRLLADVQHDLKLTKPQLTALLADRLHAPIGLDLGGETPEEIALSIVAEIQAVRLRRTAQALRDVAGPIHAPLQIAAALPRNELANAA
jgi:xanthine dehydrogenase accessory factor